MEGAIAQITTQIESLKGERVNESTGCLELAAADQATACSVPNPNFP